MKSVNIKRWLIFAIMAAGISIVSVNCKENEPDKNGNTDCLTGTWYFTENNFQKSFTFNLDYTGIEVQAADDIRNFTWTIKNDQPVIVYINETNEWEFILNCEKNELSIFSATYKNEL